MEPKYTVGQKVIFDQGAVAEKVNALRRIIATIYRVEIGETWGVTFERPVYQIKYPPKGRASVGEESLMLAEQI